MAKPNFIGLPGCEPIPILFEDRSVLAIDKPRGWLLVPVSWQKTARNLQAAINSSIAAPDFWARSRGLKFLRYVHRLDADTSGILLFAKSPGAVETFSDLFESRQMEKTYLAVVVGEPKQNEWSCRLKLMPDPRQIGRMKVDPHGKPAETRFRVLENVCEHEWSSGKPSDFGVRRHVGALGSGDVSPHSTSGSPRQLTLIEARPITGRTHQIRVHLMESGLPIVGDEMYGFGNLKFNSGGRSRREEAQIKCGVRNAECRIKPEPRHLGSYKGIDEMQFGLRAVRLAYVDPFTKRRVDIHAPVENFLKEFGF